MLHTAHTAKTKMDKNPSSLGICVTVKGDGPKEDKLGPRRARYMCYMLSRKKKGREEGGPGVGEFKTGTYP